MGAIEKFLKRWGYARLDRYGLVLTPEDRVLATRPAILDDGLGGKIVGWLEGDLAAMELEHWGASKPKKKKVISAPASLHQLPPAPPAIPRASAPESPALIAAHAPIAAAAPIASAPAAAPIAPAPAAAPVAPAPAAAAISPPSPAPAPEVADGSDAEEDEWEWEIAMARARAAAEEAEARVESRGAPAVTASPASPRKTNPGMAVVSPAKSEPEPLPPWPATEPLHETWADTSEVAPHVMSVLEKKLAADKRTPAKPVAKVAPPAKPLPSVAPARPTVIPVPQLPTVADPRAVRPVAHVSPPRGRVARGTGSSNRLEETVRTHAVPPANDDRTSPYLTLPSEVKPSGYAHTKRVAAKQL